MKSLKTYINESFEIVNENYSYRIAILEKAFKKFAATLTKNKTDHTEILKWFADLRKATTVDDVEKLWLNTFNGSLKGAFFKILGLTESEYEQAKSLGFVYMDNGELSIHRMVEIAFKIEKDDSNDFVVNAYDYGSIPTDIKFDNADELKLSGALEYGSKTYEALTFANIFNRSSISVFDRKSKYAYNIIVQNKGDKKHKKINAYHSKRNHVYFWDYWYVVGKGLFSSRSPEAAALESKFSK